MNKCILQRVYRYPDLNTLIMCVWGNYLIAQASANVHGGCIYVCMHRCLAVPQQLHANGQSDERGHGAVRYGGREEHSHSAESVLISFLHSHVFSTDNM